MPDGINFTFYPSSNRVPGVYVEMDPSQANTATVLQSTLILGYGHSGDGPNNVPIRVASQAQVQELAGIDSMLASMVAAYTAMDPFSDLWIMQIPQNPAAQPAVGGINISGTPTEDGTLCVYIAGTLYQAAVQAGDASTKTATRLVQAIHQDPFRIVGAAVDSTHQHQVNITANFNGMLGNQIDIRLNYLGRSGGEKT